MTAYQSIQKHCRQCMNNKVGEVQQCTSTDCYWYAWRFKKQPGSSLKAIRKYCLNECCGIDDPGKYKRVAECDPLIPCALHPYRFGKNPKKRKISAEHKKKMLAGLAKAHRMRLKAKKVLQKSLSSALPVKVV